MAFKHIKVQSDHDANYQVTNQGGVTLGTPNGAKPVEKVGDKATTNTQVNKAATQGRVNADTWP